MMPIDLAVVSLIIIMFFQMKQIYGIVGTTDTSIYNKFDDVHSMYDGKVESGIGLLNVIKKYEDTPVSGVIIEYPNATSIRDYLEVYNLNLPKGQQKRESTYLKELMLDPKNNTYKYEYKYNVTVIENSQGQIEINFKKVY